MDGVRQTRTGVQLSVTVQPGARVTAISCMHGGRIKIKVDAPPVDGAANEELIVFFARLLRARKADISIKSGQTSRKKEILIDGVSLESIQTILISLLEVSEGR